MTSRNLELADEFGQIVGKRDLLTYLGLTSEDDEEAALAALRTRRKYLQGMQSNPKFKREALFFIKHFRALEALLGDLDALRQALGERREAENLPILEMAIKGALAAGSLTEDQERYLRNTASDLQIENATYRATLHRLAAATGVTLATAASPVSAPGEADLYRALGVPTDATTEQIHQAYNTQSQGLEGFSNSPSTELRRASLDHAWQTLTNPATRQAYDQALIQTGPPARDRGGIAVRSPGSGAPTAPPVRTRTDRPGQLPPSLSSQPPSARRVDVPGHAFQRAPLSQTPLALAPPALGTSDAAKRLRGPGKGPPPLPPGGVVHTVNPGVGVGGPRLQVLGESTHRVVVGRDPLAIAIVLRNAGAGHLQGQITSNVPWLIPIPPHINPEILEQTVTVHLDPSAVPTLPAVGHVTIATHTGDRATVVFEASSAPPMLRRVLLGVLLVLLLILVVALASLFTQRALASTPTGLDVGVVHAP